MTLSKSRLFHFSLVIGLALSLILTACSPGQSLVGKWEVVSGSDFIGGVGSIVEFFPDGTVSTGLFAVKYDMPDKTHLKFEVGGAGIIYQFSFQGDDLVLLDSSTQTSLTLKKYQEFKPTNALLSGTWSLNYPDNSDCFKGLGLDSTPSTFVLGNDGTISFGNSVDIFIAGSSLTMTGQYTLDGQNIFVSASGTLVNSGIFTDTTETPVQGQFACRITLSHSRLTFEDAQARITVFSRSQ